MNTKRLIDTFCELVKIPSESPNDQEFIAYLEKYFHNMGGCTSSKDAYGNLIVKFAAKNSSSTTPVAFECHADTVKPGVGIKPVVDEAKGIIKSDGTTILGADCKAGIAEVIEMLKIAKKHPPLEVIIARCEEPGSMGAAQMDYSMINSKMAFVLDGEDITEMDISAPTRVDMDIHYKGIPAHAGMAPEKGISSILAASKAISRLRLGKIDEETTANVGVIQGGEVRNGVPEHTKFEVECRSLNHEKAEKLADEMESIFKQSAKEVGAEVIIDRATKVKAYSISENNEVFQTAKKAFVKNGITPKGIIVMAPTDAAHMNVHGISTIVLGNGDRNPHTTSEYLIIDEMEKITKVITDIVEDLA